MAAVMSCSAVGPVLAEERVRVDGECVSIRAAAVPLADLLDELASRTGVKLAVEGANPRQPITVDVKCGKPADAFLGVLEGQGLNYVLQMSPEGGGRVERVVLISADAKPPVKSGPAAAQAPTPEPAISEPVEIAEEEAGEKLPPGFIHSAPTVLDGVPPPGGPLRIDAQPTEGKQITFPPGFVQSPPREMTPGKPPDS
jgi:hypothetical protein